MDPIGSIKIAKDSTFAMLLEAQRRGHRLLYVIPGGLWVRDGRAGAQVAPLTVRDTYGDHYELGTASQISFGPGQVVLMRKDPPVDTDYLNDTQVLGLAQRAGAHVGGDHDREEGGVHSGEGDGRATLARVGRSVLPDCQV